MTPYNNHRKLGHKTTDYSPDGFIKIEECAECKAKFIHSPLYAYPLTMYPYPKLDY